MKRVRLRRVGRRAQREEKALARFKAEVFARDGYRCRRCERDHPICAHHIEPRGRNKPNRHDPANGVTLCMSIGTHRGCHESVHGSDGARRCEDWKRWIR